MTGGGTVNWDLGVIVLACTFALIFSYQFASKMEGTRHSCIDMAQFGSAAAGC
jgi:hypothetical protein